MVIINQANLKFRIHLSLNLLVHIGMGIVICVVFIKTMSIEPWNTMLHLHILLSAIGYFFMFEATLIYADNNIWSFFMTKTTKNVVHSILSALGIICISAGFGLSYNLNPTNRFSSAHGICGVLGFGLTMYTILHGTFMMISKCYGEIRIVDKYKHTVTGAMVTLMGLVSLCIGLNREIFHNTYFVIIATVICALCLLFMLVNPALSVKRYFIEYREEMRLQHWG